MGYITLHCNAVLFDCDGVLVDSTSAGENAWRQWAQGHNLNEDDVLQGIHGRRSTETVDKHLPKNARKHGLDRIEEIELQAANTTKPMPGAVQALESMAENWAIVTSATPALFGARLSTAGLRRPAVVVTGNDVVHGKPAPDGYLLAATKLGAAIHECIVLEDSETGVDAALAAGASVVIGVGPAALPTRAHIVVRDLTGTTWADGALHIATQTILGKRRSFADSAPSV